MAVLALHVAQAIGVPQAAAADLSVSGHVAAHAAVVVLLVHLDQRLPGAGVDRLLPEGQGLRVTGPALGVAHVRRAPRLGRDGRCRRLQVHRADLAVQLAHAGGGPRIARQAAAQRDQLVREVAAGRPAATRGDPARRAPFASRRARSAWPRRTSRRRWRPTTSAPALRPDARPARQSQSAAAPPLPARPRRPAGHCLARPGRCGRPVAARRPPRRGSWSRRLRPGAAPCPPGDPARPDRAPRPAPGGARSGDRAAPARSPPRRPRRAGAALRAWRRRSGPRPRRPDGRPAPESATPKMPTLMPPTVSIREGETAAALVTLTARRLGSTSLWSCMSVSARPAANGTPRSSRVRARNRARRALAGFSLGLLLSG